MPISRPLISILLLVGLLALDASLSSWQLSRISHMTVFPAFMFAAVSAVQQSQKKSSRISCGVIALIAGLISVGLYLYAHQIQQTAQL